MRRRKMWKSIIVLLCLYGYCNAGPVGTKRNMPIMRQDQPLISEPDASTELDNKKSTHELPVPATLTLPSNATSIRADIMDGFSCDERPYGYYADVENDCQIFHVCLPVTYADGKENIFRWSFICPEETIFSQDSFTCMRPEDMNIDCSESQNYYDLNRNFGMTDMDSNKEDMHNNVEPVPNKVHEEALSVFSDKKSPSDAVVASPSTNPQPTVVKPDKPKRVFKPISRPIQSIKNKPASLLPLRKMPQAPVASEAVLTVATQNHIDTSNQKRRRPIHKVSAESHKEETAPIPVVVENVSAEKVSALKSDHTKGAQTISVSNLGKPELPNKVTDTAEKAELVQSTPELIPSSVEELILTDENENKKEETVGTDAKTTVTEMDEKLPEETVMVSAVIEANASDSKEGTPTEDMDQKAVETSPNSELLLSSPAIFEQNSEEISLPSNTHTENIVSIETNPAPVEEEKDDKLEEEIVLNQNEKLKLAEDSPTIALDTIKETSKVESEVVEEASHVDEADDKEEASHVDEADDKGEEASHVDEADDNTTSQDNLELSAEQTQDKDSVMEHVDSENTNTPEVIAAQTDDSSLKQSMGGFKPVDAEKAAEAEAIITDFLNTLRSTETTNIKPTNEQTNEMIEKDDKDDKEELKESTENQEAPLASTDESKETEIDMEQTKPETVDESDNKHEMAAQPIVEENSEDKPTEIVEQVKTPISLLEELKNIVGHVESNTNSQSLKAGPIATYPIMNSYPADMYQIPVKIIEAPIETFEQHEPAVQQAEDEIINEPTVEVAPNAAIYTPLSIEDIVDLVKERLDQTPMEEKTKPMQLTLESLQTANANAPVEAIDKSEPETVNLEASSNAGATASKESEEIIMPIYHRLSESDSTSDSENSKADQTANEQIVVSVPIQAEENAAETAASAALKSAGNVETENTESLNTDGDGLENNVAAKTKTSRLYRSRSISNAVKMDPRKRRFLFRSDAN